jgi:UDP-N-acetylmuramoylalanine--D-glutamate ligase
MSQKVVILGGGESGAGSAVLAAVKGYRVFLSDSAPVKNKYREWLNAYSIDFEEGKHTYDRILDADLAIKSPGIPDKAEPVRLLKEKGIPVISEIEFASRYTGDAVIIGITGTNGKTTTTLLTYHLLMKAGLNVACAGNVGTSFAYTVATGSYDYYVLELSSFQLDGIVDFKPHIAVLTNITPDHLDRYNYLYENYIASKFRICMNQGPDDHFIAGIDSEPVAAMINAGHIKSQIHPFSAFHPVSDGAYLQNEQIIFNLNNGEFTMYIQDLALQGKHNAYNSMAAAITARLVEIRKETIRESLSDFQNVEHRMEFVAKVRGIEFINDSKATNVNSAFYALESMKQPVIWIAGGVDKGNDYTELIDVVHNRVKALICLGDGKEKLRETFDGIIPAIVDVNSMQDAVQSAYRMGMKGDIVLLSPACASFDLFENYEDRGRQFKMWVREL